MHQWIDELGQRLDMAEDEASRTNLRRRRCTLAATCFSTFDVCLEHVPRTLASDDDIATAVHCAVIVHDNASSILEGDQSHYLIRAMIRLLNRHFRLLHFLEPCFRELAQSKPSGVDQGLARLWPGFRRQTSSNWHVLPNPNSRWISCTVEGGQEVHYNLSIGQLLIGGKPLGKLPQEIKEHSTYASVVGMVSIIIILIHGYSHMFTYSLQKALDVVPADIPGMEFMTRSNVSGYQVGYCPRQFCAVVNANEDTLFAA